jgi:N-acyl-D-aspartate/D-glutamate deacylase
VSNPESADHRPTISRRTLLLGAGFGLANVALVAALVDEGASSSSAPRRHRIEVKGERTVANPPSLAGAEPPPPAGHVFDRVITGGRVIDPETGYDHVADVGIDGGQITSISTDTLQGKTSIDAANLVVAPGFIDLLSYAPNDYGSWFKIGDGVTTNLAMHGITDTPDGFFRMYGPDGIQPPVHYGGAFDDPWMRQYMANVATRAARPSQITALVSEVEDGLAKGWLGLDFEPEYTPWVTDDEINAMAAVAAKHQVPVFFHARYSSPTEVGADNAAALAEIVKVAETTGAAVHVDHITSTGGTHTMPQSVATLEQARAKGLDVTACMYPYTFWATFIHATRFGPGWQQRFDISYGDLQVPGTSERLTQASFDRYRAGRANTLVAAYAIPESDIVTGLQTDWIMIGSDCILEAPKGNDPPDNHPRGAGCFTRVLGHYVRDQKVLTLMAALRKMTILPAQRLEKRAPALTKKGRLQMGADADITIFDPDTVSDQSTVDDPAIAAKGIEYVLVMGQVVKDKTGLHKDVRPGMPVRSQIV